MRKPPAASRGTVAYCINNINDTNDINRMLDYGRSAFGGLDVDGFQLGDRLGFFFRDCRQGRQDAHAQRFAHLVFDFPRQLRTFFQEGARIILTLADTFAVIAVPGTRLLDDLRIRTQIEDLAFARRAFSVQDVEMRFLEWWRDLVLDDLDLGFVTDHFIARFDRAGAADIEAHGSVEFQRIAAGGGFRAAEHHADLHADLVDEDDQGIGAVDGAGQLAQGLRHQTCLQTWQGVTHVAFDLGAWRQGGHGVDHDQVDAARTHQRIADFQRLLARIRLRNQQFVQVDAQLLRVTDVQCMLGIDKGASTAQFLHFSNGLQGHGGFTRRFRTVDFHYAATRQAAYAQRDIEAERTGRHDLHFFDRCAGIHAHDRTFAKLLLDLCQCGGERLGFFRCGYYSFFIVHMFFQRSFSLGAG